MESKTSVGGSAYKGKVLQFLDLRDKARRAYISPYFYPILQSWFDTGQVKLSYNTSFQALYYASKSSYHFFFLFTYWLSKRIILLFLNDSSWIYIYKQTIQKIKYLLRDSSVITERKVKERMSFCKAWIFLIVLYIDNKGF